MHNQPLDKAQYQSYFQLMTKALNQEQVELEVMGLDIGDQMESDWIQLDGISYDPEKDTLNIDTKPLAHTIQSPSEIIVAAEGAFVSAIQVKDSENHSHILKFHSKVEVHDLNH